jgi:four helix bundle protein
MHGIAGMGARHFDELDAWKLANELKLLVYRLIDRPAVARDFDFRDQIRDSAASAPRNIAEGFGRYQPLDFRQFLRIANASLFETSNHLRDGVDRGYFTTQEIADPQVLAKRASAATTRLMKYLKTATPPDRRNREPRNREPKNREPKKRNPRTRDPENPRTRDPENPRT